MRRTGGVYWLTAGLLLALVGTSDATTISGRVTEWVGGSVLALPKEQAVGGAVVIVGSGDIWLDTKDAFTDSVRGGQIVAETHTDGNGNYTVNVETGAPPFRVIVWKAGYVPDTSLAIASLPATHSISVQRNAIGAGGKHTRIEYRSPRAKKPVVPPPGNGIAGRVTEWVGGTPLSLPREQALAGAVVVVGTGDIWLDTKDAFTDYIRGGTVVAEGRTDGDGSYALEVRGGTPPYRVIVWKEGYVPDTSSAIATIPATHSISLQRNSIEAGGKHSTLRTVSPTLPRQQGGTFTLAGGALSFDAPPGFGVHGEVEVNQVVLEGPDETMILGHAERGGVGDQLGFFADEFMKAIGPGMGADDLVSVAASEMQIAPGMPGIMRVANATVSGEQARFAFLFFTTQDYVYTWVYGARIADYQKHFNSFTSLLQTVRFK